MLLARREILAEEMAGARLQRLAILHHRLDGERLLGARKALARGLLALDDRHREPVFREPGIDVEHAQRFLDRLVACRVRRVALLPKELRGAQEQPRPHFPADDVRPLIDQDRQIAIALHPARERVADDRLRGRPHDQRLLELAGRDQLAVRPRLEPMMRDHCALFREALDVRGLLLHERQRDEQREVGVLVPGGLEHVIERALHVLPERVAPRADDHAAAHRRCLREVGARDDLLVPLGVILRPGRRDRCLRFAHEGSGTVSGTDSLERVRRVPAQSNSVPDTVPDPCFSGSGRRA